MQLKIVGGTHLATAEKGLQGVTNEHQGTLSQMPTVVGITTRDPTQIYKTMYIENEYSHDTQIKHEEDTKRFKREKYTGQRNW